MSALIRLKFGGILLAMSGLAAPQVLAYTPPQVGTACTGLRGPGPEVIGIAGNFMGGRTIRDGIVDRKSFQGCFANEASCQRWVMVHAARYPLQPGIAQCVPVRRR